MTWIDFLFVSALSGDTFFCKNNIKDIFKKSFLKAHIPGLKQAETQMIHNESHQSAFICFLENIFLSWNAMNFLELVIYKALLLYKFSRISGMNDFFVARFLLLFNLISQAITQIFRYSLGSKHESREFQIISGIKVSYTEVYWMIFPIVFAGIAYLLITFKKTVENVKDYQIQKNKNISTLESAQSQHFGTPTPSAWNITIYNPAVFTGSQIYLTTIGGPWYFW